MPECRSKPKPAGAKPNGAAKSRQKKSRPEKSREEKSREEKSHPKKSPEGKESTAEAAPEAVGEPAPPPEAVEPDPQLTPEQAEHARKKYLLRRFWISGRGYWGRRGDKLTLPFTFGLLVLICFNVGFQYGINVW